MPFGACLSFTLASFIAPAGWQGSLKQTPPSVSTGTTVKRKKDDSEEEEEEEEAEVTTPKSKKVPKTPQTFPKVKQKVRSVWKKPGAQSETRTLWCYWMQS